VRWSASSTRPTERSSRDGSPPCALVFFDLDGFKAINDNHGHLVGDRLLGTVGRRLQDSVRPGDLVGRLGGDEIAVLLHRVEEEGEADAAADRLSAVISLPFAYEGGVISVGASAGVAVARPGDSAEDLLREADAAMYREKLRA
jgi:diguanylate cyclase (GGDEF)-like protein